MDYVNKALTRAIRRSHIDRLKKNRKNYWNKGISYGREGISIMSPKQLGQVVQYPQACSCPMCGNPRKHFKKDNYQELKQKGIL